MVTAFYKSFGGSLTARSRSWTELILIPLVTTITAFTASCIGLGYLAEACARKRKLPNWFGGFTAVVIAFLWPVIAVGFVIYTGNRYAAEHPGEVNDAPAMVLAGMINISRFIFLGALSLALIGVYLARSKYSRRDLP